MAQVLLDVLRGLKTDRTPLWLMRQAGRYLPEYRDVRGQAGNFMNLCFTPKYAAEVTLQPIRRFGFDGAIIFSDILVVPHALGRSVRVEDGVGPLLEPISSASELGQAKPGEVKARLAPVYEAISQVKAALPKETTLIGFCGAPWTVATYLAEGRGSPDQRAAKLWAYRAPEDFAQLMNILVDASCEHLAAQVAAGAEVVQIFDTWAGALATDGSFERWCIEPTQALVQAFRKRCPTTPVIGFPRGAGQRLGAYTKATGVTAVSVEGTLALDDARRLCGPQIVLQGNLDPLALVAGGGALTGSVEAIRKQVQGGHIFNLGHGILPDTPIAHVEQLVRLVRS